MGWEWPWRFITYGPQSHSPHGILPEEYHSQYCESIMAVTWWCHQIEIFSTLLAFCAGWITGEFPREGKWRGPLVFSLICAWTNGWVNNREVGDLRRHRVHYDVTLMMTLSWETREYGGCIIANCSDKSLAASQITGKTRLFVNQLTRLAPK